MRKVVCINEIGWVDEYGRPVVGPAWNTICQPVKDSGIGFYLAGFPEDLEYQKSQFVDLIDDFNLREYAKCEMV